MKKKESSPVRGGIISNCVNNIPLLQNLLDLSHLNYKQNAPTELPNTSDFQTASSAILH